MDKIIAISMLLCALYEQVAKPEALAKLRSEINKELERASKRLASQTKKAQKMWTKVNFLFEKNIPSSDAWRS